MFLMGLGGISGPGGPQSTIADIKALFDRSLFLIVLNKRGLQLFIQIAFGNFNDGLILLKHDAIDKILLAK